MPPLLDLEHQDCNKCGNDFVRGTRLDQISKLVSSSMYLGRCEFVLVSSSMYSGRCEFVLVSSSMYSGRCELLVLCFF
jgi:hypothetical protein